MRVPQAITDLREGEVIVTIVRHHWFVLFRQVVGIALLFFLPFIVVPVAISSLFQSGQSIEISGGVLLFFISFWTLIMWHLIFARWTDFYFDVWLITSSRIIDIDQRGFFKRNTATIMNLDHIQDIDTELHGVMGNILNFGAISVQTAGTKKEFDFQDAIAPAKVEKRIRGAQEDLLKHGVHKRDSSGLGAPASMFAAPGDNDQNSLDD